MKMMRFLVLPLGLALFGFGCAPAVTPAPAPTSAVNPASQPSASSTTPIATVHYQCTSGKRIDATYYAGQGSPGTATQPPVPGGRVDVALSDGRTMTLPQTISASGIRYANTDESVVFWSKGNTAMVLENNKETYLGCITVVDDPGGLPEAYANATIGFSIRLPDGYRVDPQYQDQELGPGKEIGGVSFTVPESMTTGTNLGEDTHVSVEEIPRSASCSAAAFLDRASATVMTVDGTEYSVASSTGAAAGNRYEETVYAFPGTDPCMAIRYFIHYGVFENYEPGSVKAFDQQALVRQFDAIRKTLTLQ